MSVTKTCKLTALGTEYAGTISKTINCNTCQRWDTQSPNTHTVSESGFPEGSFRDAANYCRNPDADSGGPWCYLKDQNTWEYCDIPLCSGNVAFISLYK